MARHRVVFRDKHAKTLSRRTELMYRHISGIGQTHAALDLAEHLPAEKKKYYFAEEVGHYGIFNGSKWRKRIAPVVEDWIRANPRA